MTDLSRRKLIKTGLAVTAGVAGLGVAAGIADKYGLIPPDHGGIWGPGETLNYASERLLNRHLVLFVVFRDEELEAMADKEPADGRDISRAVIAFAASWKTGSSRSRRAPWAKPVPPAATYRSRVNRRKSSGLG